MMSLTVNSWWSLLCTVAIFNIGAWAISLVILNRRQDVLPARVYSARRLQLALSAVYVFGCAFRSALPVFDVPRLCLVDTWLSSVIVGRSVATCAELCFVGQWALMLRETSRMTGSDFARNAARALVPLIVVAETCSWYSVLTTSNLGHVAEESIWGLSALLLVASMLVVWPRCERSYRPWLVGWCAVGVAYVAFMFLHDVPMYWSRWLADGASGRQYLSIVQGVHDTYRHRVVSYRWLDWKSEVAWMSLYFSIAVWLSIALIHVPAPGSRARRDREPPEALSSLLFRRLTLARFRS
jgi:hypothetical protein